jgi:two-component system response regulator (stage 0 sporulation protein F)
MALAEKASREQGRCEVMTRSGSESAVDQRPRRVLLADDDDDLRTLLADALRAEGFSVTECSNGLALVETLVCRLEAGEQPFDLVVSDVRMPGVTGLSVLEGLSGWKEVQRLPMVLITAFGDTRLHELARRFGAVSLLEKPFEMTALMRVVREAIDGCGM